MMDFKGLLDDETLARIDKDAGLQQALALMAASGPSLMPQNLGSILLQGNQARDESRQQGLKGALQRQELMQQRQRQQQLKSLLGMFSPTNAQAALAGGGGPTIANAQRIGQPVTPERAQQILMLAAETGDPMLIEEVRKAKETLMPKPTYEKVGKGEQLINPVTKEVIAQGAEDLPTAVREYQYAQSQGYQGSFNDFQTQLKRAGATNIGMPSIKIGNTFGEDVAKSVASNVMGQVDAASAAASTVSTVQNMRQALPQAITGTGANARIALARLGQTLGVGGSNDAEKLAATSQIIQGMAQTQLEMAKANKGQGTFTDFERALLARAASGDINMSPPELNSLFNAVEKGARKQYETGVKQAEKMRQTPMFGQIAPFISVPDLPAAQSNNDPLGLRGK